MDNLKIILFLILFVLFLSILSGFIIYIKTKNHLGKWFYHDTLGIHIPDKEKPCIKYEKINFICTCEICHKTIIRDISEGMWF